MFSIRIPILYWISSMGCIIVFDGSVFLIKRSRYVALVFFKEGVDLFSPLVESCFRLLVILPAVADLPF